MFNTAVDEQERERPIGLRPVFTRPERLIQRLQKVPPVITVSVTLIIAILLRIALRPLIGTAFPFATFYFAVVLTSILNGVRVGALVCVVGYFIGNIFSYGFHPLPQTVTDMTGGLIYLVNCATVIMLAEAQRSTYASLAKYTRALESESQERQQADNALRLSEARYRALTEGMPQLVWLVRSDGALEYANPLFYEYTGLEAGQPVYWEEIALSEDRQTASALFDKAKEEGKPYTVEYRFRRASDQTYRWHLARVAPIVTDVGGVQQWIGAAVDIHDTKIVQQEREQVLREIEVLNVRLRRAVQETHHRVKNNLQVIAALSEMEAQDRERVPVAVLHRIGQHARTLAMIHDILTQQSRDLGVAEDRMPIQRMIEHLLPLVRSTIGDRMVTCESEEFSISSREGGAIALLINELVANSVKHGGTAIMIRFRVADDCVALTVRDNGPGFPPGFDPTVSAHTGLELVDSAARWDLRGEIRFDNHPEGGALVTISFPLVPK